MDNYPLSVKIVSFHEHFIVDISQTEPHVFDITSVGLDVPPSFMLKGYFLMDAYCLTLLNKIRILESVEVSDFIDYQCSLMTNPTDWLDQLEQLIGENYEAFEDNCHKALLHKIYVIIQLRQQELKPKRKPLKRQLVDWSEIFDGVKFDFSQVKFDLEKLNTYEEKKAYLIEQKADFLQSNHNFIPYAQKPFDTLVDIELDKLEKLASIKVSITKSQGSPTVKGKKTRIKGNINVFIDVFYQMLYEYKPEGVPFLDCTPTEIAEFIVNNFADRDGRDISLSTVRTILSPGKSDKRPSNDKRLNIKSVAILCVSSAAIGLLAEYQHIEAFILT